jgi:1-aminocyclopropane-1-carboxylate deaminase/D-cysteine desulfhydrase-like pyridoxal-dependent ACC family enzyme
MHYKLEPQGNLLLDYLVGAHVEFTDAKMGHELDAYLAQKAAEFRVKGRKPYVWDRTRVVPRASVSYAVCMAELFIQTNALGINPKAVYVSSAGATGAGVALGKKLLNYPGEARLICPMHWPWSIPEAIAQDGNAAAQLLGVEERLTVADIDADESYVAPGYGYPSAAGQEALHLLARTEGILLDPTYSAKAMAALIHDVRTGRYAPGSQVVLIHTGGIPAIFADPDKAMSRPGA